MTDLEKFKGILDEFDVNYGEWIPFGDSSSPTIKLAKGSNTEIIFSNNGEFLDVAIND